jgi:ribosomal protein L37E
MYNNDCDKGLPQLFKISWQWSRSPYWSALICYLLQNAYSNFFILKLFLPEKSSFYERSHFCAKCGFSNETNLPARDTSFTLRHSPCVILWFQNSIVRSYGWQGYSVTVAGQCIYNLDKCLTYRRARVLAAVGRLRYIWWRMMFSRYLCWLSFSC